MTDSPDCSQRRAARSRIWAAGSFGEAVKSNPSRVASVSNLARRIRRARDMDSRRETSAWQRTCMTCHAAIVSRELGIPCVVGTGEATRKLRDGELVTVDATRGVVLEGARASEPPGAASPARQAAGATTGAAALVTATQILVN